VQPLETFELYSVAITAKVNTLFKTHEINIVHRDIKDPNIFKVEGGSVLINDWSSAVEGTEVQPFSGTVREGSPYILNSLLNGKKSFASRTIDDLHALARTVFRKLYSPSSYYLPSPVLQSQDQVSDDIQKVKKFWLSVNDNWKQIFDLADKADVTNKRSYENFADALSKQLPITQ